MSVLFLFAVDGNWSQWTAWGSCTEACGGGIASRTRACDDPASANGGNDCVGAPMETQSCNTDACSSDPG